MRTLSTAFAMVVIVLGYCNASAQPTPNSTALADVEYFNADNVAKAVEELGATDVTVGQTGSGVSIVRYKIDGIEFFAAFLVCANEQSTCLGLLLGSGFRMEHGINITYEVINEYNERLPFSKAVRIGKGEVVALTRYVIADGGISGANLRSNISNFSKTIDVFKRFELGRRQTASGSDQRSGQVMQLRSVSIETETVGNILQDLGDSSSHVLLKGK